MLNRIKKYGVDNNFILTARPQESAVAIHGWLKSKGVDVPLENITGLGSSTGDAKAAWVLEKYKEGYNDVYFVDDAMQNVEAVKHVMEQLDIKGSSVQAKYEKHGKFIVDPSSKIGKDFIDDIKKSKTTPTTRKIGNWTVDLTTKEGREFSRQIDEIPTVSSSEFR